MPAMSSTAVRGTGQMGDAKYQRVRQGLQREYASAPAGMPLPSEADLGFRYQVSRITIRRAVQDLVDRGLLVKHQGRGTFVAARSPTDSASEVIDLHGFKGQMEAQGSKVTSRVLFQEIVFAPPEAAAALQLARDHTVVRLDRLRWLDGTLHQLTRSWLPCPAYSAVCDADFSEQSLLTFLKKRCGLRGAGGWSDVRIQDVSGDDAHALGIHEGSSRLRTAVTLADVEGKPALYTQTVYAAPDASASFAITGSC